MTERKKPEGEEAAPTRKRERAEAKPAAAAVAAEVVEAPVEAAAAAPAAKPDAPKKPTLTPVPASAKFFATGRRKSAVARAIMTKGDGSIVINGRKAEEYLLTGRQLYVVRQPIELTGTAGMFLVSVNIHGGGKTGQAGAIRLAIARGLIKYMPELRGALKKAGFLTRDAREVERKKYGQVKARKRFQFSKR